MKISARTCETKVEPREPDLEFYLEDEDQYVKLKVRDKSSGFETFGLVFRIQKSDGRFIRSRGISSEYGLPLTPEGQLEEKKVM